MSAMPALAEPEHLAARMRERDAGAFEAWVRVVHPLVYRLCRRLVPHPADAEDAVQETFIRAWQHAGTLRDPGAHRGWVCRIARHVCADRARGAAAREQPILDEDTRAAGLRALASDERPPDEALHAAQVRAVVADAIGRIAEKYRVVLLLREIDDLDYEEIADALGIPIGTVESRLHRARAHLGRALERHQKIAERLAARRTS
jgi:RNA polymerase sigma-70 factor (ECF subfamily)